jgi:peptidoglycan/xylan/chitin deacetylase (PgdA/CDA1 family)
MTDVTPPPESLTIVMYHYVRDLARSRYPRIKARTTDEFRRQLAHLAERYTFITRARVLAAFRGQEPLPPSAALLTFDDGYLDHYTNVFPLLHERRIEGWFFPPAGAVREGRVLDVNKLHFVLATVTDIAPVVDAIREAVNEHRADANLKPFEAYWSELAVASRFDPAEVIFVKRMLQAVLPESLRARVTDELFRRYVTADERAFAAELYVSPDQLRTMIRCGMYVGPHGDTHAWMDRLSESDQRAEVDASLRFMIEIGAPTKDWVMCYPYGAHNASLERVLAERNCTLGLTTRVAVATIGDHPLRLPRLDTNDFTTT